MINLSGVSRYFKDNAALAELTLRIEQGELFGLIGPDGAGKTTTLRIIAGLLSYSEGSAEVAGVNLKTKYEDVKPKIGYMAQRFGLYAELTVFENLMFFELKILGNILGNFCGGSGCKCNYRNFWFNIPQKRTI